MGNKIWTAKHRAIVDHGDIQHLLGTTYRMIEDKKYDSALWCSLVDMHIDDLIDKLIELRNIENE